MLHYVQDWNKVDALYYSWQSFKENPQNPFLKGLALAFGGLIALESAPLLAGKGVLVGIGAAAEAIFIREVALAGAIAIGTAISPKAPLFYCMENELQKPSPRSGVTGGNPTTNQDDKWLDTYRNVWSGFTIKSFDIQKMNIKNIVGHIFSDDHIKRGLMKIGASKQDIIDKIIQVIKDVDATGVFKSSGINNGLTNQVQLMMEGLPIEIRLRIFNGNVINMNAFIGHSARNMGHLIKWP